MKCQSTSNFLMVRPIGFASNLETIEDNSFQKVSDLSILELEQHALAEFEEVVSLLRSLGCQVIVIDPIHPEKTPDAVFPNNWFSLSPNQCLTIFPMKADSRAAEVRNEIKEIITQAGLKIHETRDWQFHRGEGRFFEGTGSMVLDHMYKKGYVARSERSNVSLGEEWGAANEYEMIFFDTTHTLLPKPVYHTNVVMAVLSHAVVICLEVIAKNDQEQIINNILQSGRELIAISYQQMNSFCGNVLEINSPIKGKCVIMSTTAFHAFTQDQKEKLAAQAIIEHCNIPTIENIGGGGIRCMLAELF